MGSSYYVSGFLCECVVSCANVRRAVYFRGDPYESSDAVFGVKKSLIVDVTEVDAATAKEYGVKEGSALLRQDFVLASSKEADDLRDSNAMEAMRNLGLNVKLVDHLPVPDLD